jgi:hypothetical protein
LTFTTCLFYQVFVFSSNTSFLFLASASFSLTAEDRFKQLSITHDMTKKERLQNREKLAEAKNKNDVLEENTNTW